MLLGKKLTATIAPIFAALAPVLATRGTMVRQTSINMDMVMVCDMGCVLFGCREEGVGMRRSKRQSNQSQKGSGVVGERSVGLREDEW